MPDDDNVIQMFPRVPVALAGGFPNLPPVRGPQGVGAVLKERRPEEPSRAVTPLEPDERRPASAHMKARGRPPKNEIRQGDRLGGFFVLYEVPASQRASGERVYMCENGLGERVQRTQRQLRDGAALEAAIARATGQGDEAKPAHPRTRCNRCLGYGHAREDCGKMNGAA